MLEINMYAASPLTLSELSGLLLFLEFYQVGFFEGMVCSHRGNLELPRAFSTQIKIMSLFLLCLV